MSAEETLSIPSETRALLDAIRKRRSFGLADVSPEPIDLSLVETMLEAANWAPSHGKTEPWRFTVFAGDGRQKLSDAFGEAYRLVTPPALYSEAGEAAQRERAWQAPVWISIGMSPEYDLHGKPRMPEWEEQIAAGISAYIIHTVAASMGLAAKWTSGKVVIHPHVAKVADLEEPARLLGFLYVGMPKREWPQGIRRPIAQKVRWITE
jgi:Nitroreductase